MLTLLTTGWFQPLKVSDHKIEENIEENLDLWRESSGSGSGAHKMQPGDK